MCGTSLFLTEINNYYVQFHCTCGICRIKSLFKETLVYYMFMEWKNAFKTGKFELVAWLL